MASASSPPAGTGRWAAAWSLQHAVFVPGHRSRSADAISAMLDTAGFEHGTVADASFDSDTGSIVSILTSDGVEIATQHLHSLGSYAVIVDA